MARSSAAAWMTSLIVALSTAQSDVHSQELRPNTAPAAFAAPTMSQATNAPSEPRIIRPQARTIEAQFNNAQVSNGVWIGNAQSSSSTAVEPSSFTANPTKPIPFISGKPDEESKLAKPSSRWSATITTILSLAAVIGLFLIVARFLQGIAPKPMRNLPSDVVKVLGRTQLAPRQQMIVIRFGRKLILVSQQLGQTCTLSEIDSAEEVDHLLGLCEENSPNSVSGNFRDVLQQIASVGTRVGSKKKDVDAVYAAKNFDRMS